MLVIINLHINGEENRVVILFTLGRYGSQNKYI